MSSRVGTARIVIRNLSSCGLGGKCDEVLYKGEEVAVLLVNVGAIDAIVMWVKDRAFGLQFRETIDPESALAAPTERIVKPYEVPAYFRPEISTYRSGFSKKSAPPDLRPSPPRTISGTLPLRWHASAHQFMVKTRNGSPQPQLNSSSRPFANHNSCMAATSQRSAATASRSATAPKRLSRVHKAASGVSRVAASR